MMRTVATTAVLFTFAVAAGLVSSANAAAPIPQGIKFQGIKFQGIKFQGIKFQGIKFQGIKFQGIKFQGVQLDGSELQLTGWGTNRDGSVWIRTRDLGVAETWRYANGTWTHSVSRGGMLGATFTVVTLEDGAAVERTARVVGHKRDTSSNTMTFFEDGAHASNSDVALYALELDIGAPGNPSWIPLCDDQAGTGYGLFLDGQWDEQTGAYSPDGLSFACQDVGVLAKCVTQWGYKPWKELASPLDGAATNLAPLHRACVRAARADYCADGVSFTEEGTPVDMFDAYGFNVWASWSEMNAFEAAWEAANCPLGADGLPTDCKDFDFVLESIIGESGTVAHHEERYGYQFLLLSCEPTAPASFDWYSVDYELWGYFGDHLYSDIVGVRSDPTQWPFLGPELPADPEPLDGPIEWCAPFDPLC